MFYHAFPMAIACCVSTSGSVGPIHRVIELYSSLGPVAIYTDLIAPIQNTLSVISFKTSVAMNIVPE